MTRLVAAPKKFTVAEYLEIERTTGEKHACYKGGTIEPLAGAGIPRNRKSVSVRNAGKAGRDDALPGVFSTGDAPE